MKVLQTVYRPRVSIQLLENDGSRRVDMTEGVIDETEMDHAPGKRVLVCSQCHARITRSDYGLEVNGSQKHVFFNPQGIIFEIGCFSLARNASRIGPKVNDFSWFTGFAWQAIVCATRQVHLGWRYTRASGEFFGLILSALTEEEG
jgi:hypothetical protein